MTLGQPVLFRETLLQNLKNTKMMIKLWALVYAYYLTYFNMNPIQLLKRFV